MNFLAKYSGRKAVKICWKSPEFSVLGVAPRLMGEVEARVGKVQAQAPSWCVMYKIPYTQGAPDGWVRG